MGIDSSKLKLENSGANEIGSFVSNLGEEYRKYKPAILKSGWSREFVPFQYDSHALDLIALGVIDPV